MGSVGLRSLWVHHYVLSLGQCCGVLKQFSEHNLVIQAMSEKHVFIPVAYLHNVYVEKQ